jgi:predicted transcriptional regulator YheO
VREVINWWWGKERVAKQSLDPRMKTLLPLVRGLADMFGPACEVVLHDLSALPRSIVAIENGQVTNRAVGDVPTDRMLRSLRHADHAPDTRLYVSSSGGRILKSLAVTLRDESGTPFAILGINLDVSEIVQAQRVLASLSTVSPTEDAAVTEREEIFANDIREVVAGMITQLLHEMGKTPATMTRDEKLTVVARLEERGAFLVKRAAEQVAEALNLSRYTIFSYLKEIRHGGDESSPAAAGEPLHTRRGGGVKA